MRPLSRDFYERNPKEVSRELLGQLLVRRGRDGICVGRIVETEAYLAHGDPACHSHRGMNRKNATMFGPPGHLYVYPIHARHCLNTVTEQRHVASAVLIRAVEPLEGVALMAGRRGACDLLDLARGPARLCEAFNVDRQLDGWDLTRGTRIWIAAAATVDRDSIAVSQRVGVTSAQDLELRFFLRGSRFVSKHRTFAGAQASSLNDLPESQR
jgi:DNA-3-methyladenine glycosylase